MIRRTPTKRSRRSFPGLLEYLEKRLGTSVGSSEERNFHCHKCIEVLGDESSKRKLGINLSRGVAKCFRCGYKAKDLETLFRGLNNGALRIDEAAIIHGEIQSVERKDLRATLLETLRPPQATVLLQRQPLPSEYVPMWKEGTERRCTAGLAYLRKRKVSAALCEPFQLGYCDSGEYAGRIIFPVIQRGEQVYFTSRYCGDHFAKSRNPMNKPGFYSKTDCILNYDNLVGQPVIAIVEGPFSCMAYAAAGAIMGKEISQTQVALIAELVPLGLQEVIVSLDPDASAYADEIYFALDGVVPEVSILYLGHGDPDDRRPDLPALLESRRRPSVSDRLRARLVKTK
jgi:hypothetical protein